MFDISSTFLLLMIVLILFFVIFTSGASVGSINTQGYENDEALQEIHAYAAAVLGLTVIGALVMCLAAPIYILFGLAKDKTQDRKIAMFSGIILSLYFIVVGIISAIGADKAAWWVEEFGEGPPSEDTGVIGNIGLMQSAYLNLAIATAGLFVVGIAILGLMLMNSQKRKEARKELLEEVQKKTSTISIQTTPPKEKTD
jgi:MFS family permease